MKETTQYNIKVRIPVIMLLLAFLMLGYLMYVGIKLYSINEQINYEIDKLKACWTTCEEHYNGIFIDYNMGNQYRHSECWCEINNTQRLISGIHEV